MKDNRMEIPLERVFNMSQMELFDAREKETTFLHTIHNGKPSSLSMKELFNPEIYHTLHAVSYVASPRYFFHVTKDFKQIHLILGQSDVDFMELDLFNIEKRVKEYFALPDQIRKKIQQGQVQIRYGQPSIVIHSKIYLLKGDEHCRVIVGSANFSQNAFGNKNQFEIIRVDDNDWDLYQYHMDYYREIETFTLDYVPERAKKQEINLYLIRDPEFLTNVILEEFDQNRDKLVIDEETMKAIQSSPEKVEQKKNEVQAQKLVIETIYKPDKKKEHKVKTINELEKVKNKLQTKLASMYKKVESIDHRIPLYTDHQGRLYTRVGEEEEITPYGKTLDKEEIKKRLQNIHRFVEAYDKFTAQDDPTVVSKIYEVILYGFLSPFIWKIRDQFVLQDGMESMRSIFRPFLIMSGRAESGKTTVLEYLGRLIGHHEPFMGFRKFGNDAHRARRIEAVLQSEIVSPLLVDEFPSSFFTRTGGEDLVKTVSNEFAGPHPCVIGTTNTSGFSMPRQVDRRVYYLNISNTFRKDPTSKNYLMETLQQVDTALFKDFVVRMKERIKQGQPLYNKHEIEDVLYAAREIFLEYYNETGMEVPGYFPRKKFEDYQELARNEWLNIFQFRQDAFEINEKENTVRFDIDQFVKGRERQTLINMLPNEGILSDTNILVVKKDVFFEFLEIQDRSSWIKRLTSVFRR